MSSTGGRQYPALFVSLLVIALAFISPQKVLGQQTFTGKFSYEDREFGFNGFTGKIAARPIRYAEVRILSGSTTIASGATDAQGAFRIETPTAYLAPVRAICVTSSAMTPSLMIDVRVAEDDFTFGDFYSVSSALIDSPPSGWVEFGTTVAIAGNDAGKAFNLWDVLVDSMEFVASAEAAGKFPETKLSLIWRFDHSYAGSFYGGGDVDKLIYIGPLSPYDDTIICHEIGHFIDEIFSKSDSPGGRHYIGHDNQDIRLSWGEGLATYLGSAIRKFKGYANPEIYVNTDGQYLEFSFEIEGLVSSTSLMSRTGSTNELAVSASLWDMTDGPNSANPTAGTDDDPMEVPFSSIWRVLHQYMPTIARPGISIETFWDGWFSPQINNGLLEQMRYVFADLHGIEYFSDWDEPDGIPDYAMPVGNTQIKHHTFYPEGDEDWISIRADAGRKYVIKTSNLSNGASTFVEIYAPDMTTMLASEGISSIAASSLNWTAPSDGTYFVRSRRKSSVFRFARYGSYDLKVTQTSAETAGAVITVSKPGLGGAFISLSEAVRAAAAGDTIQIIDSGMYSEPLNITGKGLTLKAAAGKRPVIDGHNNLSSPAISVTDSPEFRIEGLTILGGSRGISIRGSKGVIVNTIVSGMSVDGIAAAGISSSVEIVHCTIADNGRFGVWIAEGAASSITNTVFDDNAADLGDDGSTGNITVANSLISSPRFSGAFQNISGDPKFVDQANNNFRLLPESPAIDHGNPFTNNLPATDADGIPRTVDGLLTGTPKPDMGAYEYLPGATLASTGIFSQFVLGGTGPIYETTLIALNPGKTAATANVSLYKSNGELLPVQLSESLRTEIPSEESRNSFNLSISSMGMARLDAAKNGDMAVGFARYISSSPINGTAIIKAYQGNRLQTAAGISISKPAKKLIFQVNEINASTGFAVANPGTEAANLVLTLRDEGGKTVSSQSRILPAWSHFAEFASERFPDSSIPGFKGSIEMLSDRDIAAMSLRLDNPGLDILSDSPPLVDEMAAELIFPLVVDGGSYRTGILLTNPSADKEASVKLEFISENGEPLSIDIGNTRSTSHEIVIKPAGVAHIFTNGISPEIRTGWLRMTGSSEIGGSILLQSSEGARISSAAAVLPEHAERHLLTYIETGENLDSGIALCNPNGAMVNVTLNLRDPSGQIVAATQFVIPPFAKIAKFVNGQDQWFPEGFENFTGTLEIVASSPISAAALRYDQKVFTTLPVIPVR